MLRKKELVTIITPIPGLIPRQLAIDILHSHGEVITLNPLVLDYKGIKAPRNAASDEYYSTWYKITERIQYVPGIGKVGSGKIAFNGCFHNMPWGLQAHIYAPMNTDLRYKYQIGGNQPGIEPRQTLELGLLDKGAPSEGLYLREDVEVKANIAVISFVKSQLKAASKLMVERIIKKAELVDRGELDAMIENGKLKTINPADRSLSPSGSPSLPSSTPGGAKPQDKDAKRPDQQGSPPLPTGSPASPASIPYKLARPPTLYGAYRPDSATGPGPEYGGPYPGYPRYPMHQANSSFSGTPTGDMQGYYPQHPPHPATQHLSMYGQYPPSQFQQMPGQYAELQAFTPVHAPYVPQGPMPVEMAGDYYHAQAVPRTAPLAPQYPSQRQGGQQLQQQQQQPQYLPYKVQDPSMQQLEQRLQQQHLTPPSNASSTPPQTGLDSDTIGPFTHWTLPSQQQQQFPVSRPQSGSSDASSLGSYRTNPNSSPNSGGRSPGLDKTYTSDLATHSETTAEHHQEGCMKVAR